MRIAVERREQALLFLNRRGYAPLTLCRACGHRFACTICDAWLVDHRFRQRLVCHHCGFSMPRPHVCPNCAAEESLVAISGMNLRLFARPNLFRYTNPQQDELLQRWDSPPAASQTSIHFEFRSRSDGAEMWINGCYAGQFPAAGGFRQPGGRTGRPAGRLRKCFDSFRPCAW